MKARVVAEKQDGADEKLAKDKKAVLPTRQTSLLRVASLEIQISFFRPVGVWHWANTVGSHLLQVIHTVLHTDLIPLLHSL